MHCNNYDVLGDYFNHHVSGITTPSAMQQKYAELKPKMVKKIQKKRQKYSY